MVATQSNPGTESPALAMFVQHVTGNPQQPIELDSTPICTHFMFEGPEGLFSGDDGLDD